MGLCRAGLNRHIKQWERSVERQLHLSLQGSCHSHRHPWSGKASPGGHFLWLYLWGFLIFLKRGGRAPAKSVRSKWVGSKSSLLPVLLFPLDLERLESWECPGCEGSKHVTLSHVSLCQVFTAASGPHQNLLLSHTAASAPVPRECPSRPDRGGRIWPCSRCS